MLATRRMSRPVSRGASRPASGDPFSTVIVGPRVSSATVAADGETLTIVFTEAITIGAGGSGGFTIRGEAPADATIAATYSSGDTTDTLVFTLASTVYATEGLRLAYAQPGDGMENGAGEDLPSFVTKVATNNSAVADGILRDGDGDPIPDGNGRAIPVTI